MRINTKYAQAYVDAVGGLHIDPHTRRGKLLAGFRRAVATSNGAATVQIPTGSLDLVRDLAHRERMEMYSGF